MSGQKEQAVVEETKPILNSYFHPSTKFELDMKQLSIMEASLAPFQWLLSIVSDAKQEAAKKYGVKSAFESDYQKNEDGSFKIDPKTNNPLLRNDFWEDKKENNSLTISDTGKVNKAQSN